MATILNERESRPAMNSSMEQLANIIAQSISGLNPPQLEWHPQGKWSIAEIVEHLSLTYSGTRIVFARCLESGAPSATMPTIKDRVSAFVVTRLGYFPNGRQAPGPTRPKGKPSSAVVSGIGQDIAIMDEAIQHCERRFGSNIKLVNHPVLGPLSGPEWRSFHFVHGRHHVRQIWRLRKLITSDPDSR